MSETVTVILNPRFAAFMAKALRGAAEDPDGFASTVVMTPDLRKGLELLAKAIDHAIIGE